MSKTLKFNPKARIIRTIGDQLISGPEAAVIELVKNSYDADATQVTVKFVPPLEKDRGRIIVKDDGHGMSLDDVHNKWMEPATTSKLRNGYSPGGRRLLGSKGIGRFAAAKLGKFMALNSISKNEAKCSEVIIPQIDWSIFNEDTYLSDISIEYIEEETTANTGTEIEISSLNESWTADKIHRLHVELKRLLAPRSEDEPPECRFYLDLSECTPDSSGFDGQQLFSKADSSGRREHKFEVTAFPVVSACDYEVEGTFDTSGNFVGTVTIHRGNQPSVDVTLSVPLGQEEEDCGTVDVHFYIFDREGQSMKTTMRKAGMGEMTVAKAREVLDAISGVAVYKNGFRIRPYGDPQNDWLTLDTRRVQNPSLRIGHNQISGNITVQDESESGLFEKSSREGFEENSNYRRLRKLILTLLAEAIEPRRYDFRDKAGIGRSNKSTFPELRQLADLKKIRSLLKQLPESEQEKAEEIVDREATLLTEKIDAMESRQAVLEARSSLGTIVGEVLHEGSPSATYIYKTALKFDRDKSKLFGDGEESEALRGEFPSRMRLMHESADRLNTLFELLEPLAGGKRGPVKSFNPINVALDAKSLLAEHTALISVNAPPNVPEIIGYPQDLYAAFVNILKNAIYWLEYEKLDEPEVRIRFEADKGQVSIFIEDNGPGIPDEFKEQIFDVGFSLKPEGTGLGLNIAREAIARSGGELLYHPEFSPGTRFELRFKTKD